MDNEIDQDESSIGRRSYLKFTSTAIAGLGIAGAASGTATAASGGYGVNDYGIGAYGGSTEADSGSATGPTIESLNAAKSSKSTVGPHAEFTVEWVVSAPASELATVEITVRDTAGVVTARTISNLWPSEIGSTDFLIKYATGETFDIYFTAIDDDGSQTTAEITVTA